jgi:hypothetical protein
MAKILFDANAIIELHQFSLWNPIIHACQAVVTPIIRHEVKFYKDAEGQKQPINLSKDIEDQKIEEISVSLEIYNALQHVLTASFLEGIDEGEREALAFLHSSRQSSYLFCTGDLLAIKCLGVLGLKGVSLQDLLEQFKIGSNRHYKNHSRELFEKMLNRGLVESHLHKK